MNDNRQLQTRSIKAMQKRREQLLGKAYYLFYDDPVHIVRGEGVYLYDTDGKKYLDIRDATFKEPGQVGLWTKADAQTHFDDFRASMALDAKPD